MHAPSPRLLCAAAPQHEPAATSRARAEHLAEEGQRGECGGAILSVHGAAAAHERVTASTAAGPQRRRGPPAGTYSCHPRAPCRADPRSTMASRP